MTEQDVLNLILNFNDLKEEHKEYLQNREYSLQQKLKYASDLAKTNKKLRAYLDKQEKERTVNIFKEEDSAPNDEVLPDFMDTFESLGKLHLPLEKSPKLTFQDAIRKVWRIELQRRIAHKYPKKEDKDTLIQHLTKLQIIVYDKKLETQVFETPDDIVNFYNETLEEAVKCDDSIV